MSVHYQPVECKSFLHHFNKKFLPFNWGANPYRGCEHSCPYCFARYTHEYLDKELSRPGWKREAVNLGSVCDPYQPAEKKFRITRKVLEVFAKHKNPLFVGTKSNLILRDLDILSEMATRTILLVNFTITTLDENIRSKIEPRAETTKKRLDAVKQLSDAGVTVGILFMPIFPYLNDDFENINGVVKAVSDAGAKDMIPGVLDLRAACRNRVLSLIKEEFPDLLPKYLALYKTAYAPTDYTGRIYRIVETAQRRCGFKKLEMPVFREKQTKLEGWIKKDEDQA
jgi:DNA repair photolyase